MCGLSGYVGLTSFATRLKLATALGLGIDSRGGHAAGYVSVPRLGGTAGVRVAKRIGTWGAAAERFRHGAASGEVCMMHSRYATTGAKELVSNAHPFVIRREGKAVLYGAHNGVVTGTYSTASKNKRQHTVDSKEVFELLADGDFAAINKLDGYGVLTWIVPGTSDVHIARLSKSSDLVVAELDQGGFAWASTWKILSPALTAAGLSAEHVRTCDEVGRVYRITGDNVLLTEEKRVHVDNSPRVYAGWDEDYVDYGYTGTRSYRYLGGHSSSSFSGGMYGTGNAADDKLRREWMADTSYRDTFAQYKRDREDADEALRRHNQAKAWAQYEEYKARQAKDRKTLPVARDGEDTGVRVRVGVVNSAEESARVFMAAQDGEVSIKDLEVPDTERNFSKAVRTMLSPVDDALNTMSDEQLDEMSDEEWDELIERYRNQDTGNRAAG